MVVPVELTVKSGLHGLLGKAGTVEPIHIRKWFDFWFCMLVTWRCVTVIVDISPKRPLIQIMQIHR